MTVKLIYLDADDMLVAMLQPFADAHIARDRLNLCEARNLKLCGYGAKGLTLSMIETTVDWRARPSPNR